MKPGHTFTIEPMISQGKTITKLIRITSQAYEIKQVCLSSKKNNESSFFSKITCI